MKFHEFVINAAGTAFCTCQDWIVWGFSEAFAKKNHQHHVNGLPKKEKQRGK